MIIEMGTIETSNHTIGGSNVTKGMLDMSPLLHSMLEQCSVTTSPKKDETYQFPGALPESRGVRANFSRFLIKNSLMSLLATVGVFPSVLTTIKMLFVSTSGAPRTIYAGTPFLMKQAMGDLFLCLFEYARTIGFKNIHYENLPLNTRIRCLLADPDGGEPTEYLNFGLSAYGNIVGERDADSAPQLEEASDETGESEPSDDIWNIIQRSEDDDEEDNRL